jgi:gluconolactonase
MNMIAYIAAILILVEATALADYDVQKISDGYKFTEGPVWSMSDTLLFSDIPSNKIYELATQSRVFRDPSGNSNGLTLDNDGRLIACEHGNRRVTRTEKDGSITVLAHSYQGKPLNSPNDVVVKSDGSIYFTDPTYGGHKNELGFQGVYRIRQDGSLDLLVRDFVQPNGLCFSPDEKLLYIADSSDLRHIRVFEVTKDGTLTNGRVFAKIDSDKGVPDGMKVDTRGKLYVTGPGGVWVFDKSGKHIETIAVPETPANLAWGDKDGKTLYITARTSIYKVRAKVGGQLPGRKK